MNNIYDSPYKDEFELAEPLAVMDDPHTGKMLIQGGNWRQQLEELSDPPPSPELLDFFESLLIIDHSERPSASAASLHPYTTST